MRDEMKRECVCVCVCVREREREREGEREIISYQCKALSK